MVAIAGPNWKLAASLIALFNEADRLYPNRSTASDGSIGDAAHASRDSDHNPDASGDVLGADITDDKANGCDADLLAQHLVASRDSRLKYVIWNGTIVKSYGSMAWKPRPYDGINAHEKHTHISVLDTGAAKNDLSPWFPTAPSAPAPQPPSEEDDPMLTFETAGKPVFLLSGGKAAGIKSPADLAALRKAVQTATGRPIPHVALSAGTFDEWLARFRNQ